MLNTYWTPMTVGIQRGFEMSIVTWTSLVIESECNYHLHSCHHKLHYLALELWILPPTSARSVASTKRHGCCGNICLHTFRGSIHPGLLKNQFLSEVAPLLMSCIIALPQRRSQAPKWPIQIHLSIIVHTYIHSLTHIHTYKHTHIHKCMITYIQIMYLCIPTYWVFINAKTLYPLDFQNVQTLGWWPLAIHFIMEIYIAPHKVSTQKRCHPLHG